MPYCPNCGRYISLGDTECAECGSSLADGMEDGAGPAHDSSAGNEHDRPDEGEPPRDESTEQAAENSSEQTGRTRRTALAFAGGILGLMVVGTWGLETLDETGPKDVVGNWRDAWIARDAETFGDLWHSDSPRQAEAIADQYSRVDIPDGPLQYYGETRKLLDKTDTTASVRDVFLLTNPESAVPRRINDVVELRTENGAWRIWNYRTEHSEQASGCSRGINITGLGDLECE